MKQNCIIQTVFSYKKQLSFMFFCLHYMFFSLLMFKSKFKLSKQNLKVQYKVKKQIFAQQNKTKVYKQKLTPLNN